MKSFWTYKIKRELTRIKQQLKSVPEFFYEPFLRWQYDRSRDQRLKPINGEIKNTNNKIAIYLIFQPAGLLKSTFTTCQHLISNGYSPLVISNCPLSQQDQHELIKVSWKTMVRPNFGYDFGGYRDGIWLINKHEINPHSLIIINDSIWFPICENDDFIRRMENTSAHFVGALQLEPTRENKNLSLKKRPFFGSFFWLIKSTCWKHPEFQNFWLSYKNTSNKHKTIRRGERKFSHTIFDAGISSQAIFSRQMFDAKVMIANAHELYKILTDLRTIDDRLLKSKEVLLSSFEDSAEWKNHSTNLIIKITEKQNITATAPIATLEDFGVSFVKKSKDPGNIQALKSLVEFSKDFNNKRPTDQIIQEWLSHIK